MSSLLFSTVVNQPQRSMTAYKYSWNIPRRNTTITQRGKVPDVTTRRNSRYTRVAAEILLPQQENPICLQPSLRAPLKCSSVISEFLTHHHHGENSELKREPVQHVVAQLAQKQTCRLTASTDLALLSFNDGSLSYSRVMEELGLTISHQTLVYLSKRDHLRNKEKARRTKETYKRLRRQMTAHTSVAESLHRRRDKKVYSSGQ